MKHAQPKHHKLDDAARIGLALHGWLLDWIPGDPVTTPEAWQRLRVPTWEAWLVECSAKPLLASGPPAAARELDADPLAALEAENPELASTCRELMAFHKRETAKYGPNPFPSGAAMSLWRPWRSTLV